MKDFPDQNVPKVLEAIASETEILGFDMASEPRTGALLQTLAASKPGARMLELGTGTGLSCAWILAGMDQRSTLVSVDNDASAQAIARKYLGEDQRLQLVCQDASEWLELHLDERFDFIFADAWPGKFSHLKLTLERLTPGGFYVIDDLLPQDNWPDNHAPRVPALIQQIESLSGYTSIRLAWASGLMIVVRQSAPSQTGV